MSELGDAIERLEFWARGEEFDELTVVIAAARERDALAAVIEEARAEVGDLERSDWLRDTVAGGRLAAILSRTPSDVLVGRDARIRAEVIDWIAGESDFSFEFVAAAREHFGLTKGADRG